MFQMNVNSMTQELKRLGGIIPVGQHDKYVMFDIKEFKMQVVIVFSHKIIIVQTVNILWYRTQFSVNLYASLSILI